MCLMESSQQTVQGIGNQAAGGAEQRAHLEVGAHLHLSQKLVGVLLRRGLLRRRRGRGRGLWRRRAPIRQRAFACYYNSGNVTPSRKTPGSASLPPCA